MVASGSSAMIEFPKVFWLLFILPPVWLILWRRYLTGKQDLQTIGGRWRSGRLMEVFVIKWFFSSLTFTLFIVFLVLALAGFSGREHPVSYEPKGLDVIFVVDISRSMLAEDISPNRLRRSSEIIHGLIDGIGEARYGVTVFKGAGIQVIPLTEDTETVSAFVGALNTGILTSPGTNIEAGIRKAIESFPESIESRRMIFLFSDGGSLEGDPLTAAEAAKERDIIIHTIGAADTKGVPIPLQDGTFVKNDSGKIVNTFLRDEELRMIAEITGGQYFNLTDRLALGKLLLTIEEETLSGMERGFRLESTDIYRGYLAVALLSLLMNLIIRIARWKDLF